MEYLILGFVTGLSLIFAIGAQNIFVIEQGLKKQYVFLVCAVCSISDFLLIFLGIFIFHFFSQYFNLFVEIILNILLIIFLTYFIYSKVKYFQSSISLNNKFKNINISNILFKTFSFTYLNAHVYSDTVFFLGNFSKNFFLIEKIYFGLGATIASFIFFFMLGYLSSYLSRYVKNIKVWKYINLFIISFMFILMVYILKETIDLF